MSPALLELAKAAKSLASKGVIRTNSSPARYAPRGKRSHRNGEALSPERMKEVSPEILRRLKRGEEYITIIQAMGVTARTITLVKRANGIPVRGDERDGKVFLGTDSAGRERWGIVKPNQK